VSFPISHLLYLQPYLVPFTRYSLLYVHHRFILLFLLRLALSMEAFPWVHDFRKILHGDQTMAKVHNGEEILPKALTPAYGT